MGSIFALQRVLEKKQGFKCRFTAQRSHNVTENPKLEKYREKEFVFKSLLTGAFITIAVGVNLSFIAFLLELIVSLREQQSTQRRTRT
jgi:hypothetical protein